MLRLFALILPLLLLPLVVHAQTEDDLQRVLARLDSVIDAAPHYTAVKQQRIAAIRQRLAKTKTPMSRYEVNMQLYEEYRSYKNDSAIDVLNDNLRLARSMKRKDLAGDCLSLIAYQSSTVGRYPDAVSMLKQVDEAALSAQGRFHYYRAQNHFYSETAYYSHLKSVRDSSYAVAGRYEALLMQTLDPHSWEYQQYLFNSLMSQGNMAAAQRVCDQWLKMTPADSRDFAIVAYYEYLAHITVHDDERAIYWAAQSAISDIMHGVMDQASLWSVADCISGRDIKRSYKYIKYAWQCATTFGTGVRTMQISPVLSVIENEYQEQLDKANRRLSVIVVVIALLAAWLLFMLYYSIRQRRRLAATRNDLRLRNEELAESNAKLAESNDKLQEANSRITAVNARLHESEKIKEAYIGRFLALCSDYVDRMDKERKHASRMIKTRKIDELAQMLRSTEQRDKDVDELYNNFDETFLNIFPSFVDDFNALLQPDHRIVPPKGKLNTTLRIFALIRLGIDDSGKIASFLHYSVNTIYNYRARTKNGCLHDRDTFEDEVKRLGAIGDEA